MSLFRLSIEGNADITERIAGRLIGLSASDAMDGTSDTLEVRLADPEGTLALPDPGAVLTLALGAAAPLQQIGRYVVDEVRLSAPPRRMVIKALSADLPGALRVHREQNWIGKGVLEIVAEIGSRHGFAVRTPDRIGARYVSLVQSESDISFLQSLADAHDAGLRFLPAERPAGKPVLVFALRGVARDEAIRLKEEGLSSYNYVRSERVSVRSVKARYSDAANKRVSEVIARDNAQAGPVDLELPGILPSGGHAFTAAHSALRRAQRSREHLQIFLPGFVLGLRAGASLLLDAPEPVKGGWVADRVHWRLDSDRGLTASADFVR